MINRPRFDASALRISGLYGIVSAIYILVSDKVLAVIAGDLSTFGLLQTYKGWIFVALTTAVLLHLLNSAFQRLQGFATEMQRARSRLDMALRATGGAVWTAQFRDDGAISLAAFGALAEAIGFAPDRPITGAELRERIHPDDQATFDQELKRYLSGQTPAAISVFRIRLGDGAYGWVKVLLGPIEGGTISGTVFDITELQLASEKLSEVIASAELGTWRLDFRTGINEINDRWAELLGYTRDELGTMTFARWRSMVHPDDLDEIDQDSMRYRSGDYFFGNEFRMRHKNGSWVWILSRGRTVEFGPDGQAVVLVGIHIDISRRKELEAQLRSDRDFLLRLTETSISGILALDASGKIVFVNREAENLLGASAQQMIGLRHDDPAWRARTLDGSPLAPEDFPFAVVTRTRAPLRDMRLKFMHPDGVERVLSVNATPTNDTEGAVHVVCTVNDITAQLAKDRVLETAAAEATFAALHDPMTGLPNRVLFEDHLANAIQMAHRTGALVAQVFIDIDNFKQINDRYGHQLGDMLICRVAERLEEKKGDARVFARVAGDEFTLLYEIPSQSSIPGLVSELLRAFEVPFELADSTVFLSASIGISVYPLDASTAEELWLNSDMAMYEAKATGRNQYVQYSGVIRDRMAREAKIVQSLRRALHENRFTMVLQPKVMLSDPAHVVGAEALIRCHDLGIQGIGPAEFIPIAEKAGLSRQIDLLVIDLLGPLLSDLRAKGRSLRVSVNVSPESLRMSGFGSTLLGAIARAGLTNRDILFELTEGVIMDNSANVREAVNLFLQHGFELSADDFGTGYSSLAYLHQLHLKEIKIDRSFILRLGLAERASDPVVRAILAMANSFGIRTVAEGIETEAQLKWLREHGCTMGQGYLFGQGVPVEAFVERHLETTLPSSPDKSLIGNHTRH